MATPKAANTKRRTRIQAEKEALILDAALEVFSSNGFRGSTVDQIATAAGMSKPNLLYYFPGKDIIHRILIDRLLDVWLDPLREIDANGHPVEEICKYIDKKLEMARDFPRESRLFANEMLQGAPRIQEELLDLKLLVGEKSEVIKSWISAGQLSDVDPRHFFFAVWSTTQHYADFDAQIQAVLDDEQSKSKRFEDAGVFLKRLFTKGITT